MPTAPRRLWFVARFVAAAVAPALSAMVLAIVGYLILLTAFMEHGPIGPIERSWAGPTAIYGSMALTSGVAGYLYTDATQASWRWTVLLGTSSGFIHDSTWLIIHLARGEPLSAFDSWSYLLPPALAAISCLVGGIFRRGGLRHDPYRWA